MEISRVMFALLRFAMGETELCDEIKNLITTESLPALFKLSKKHDLAHLVGDALDKNGLLPEGSEAKKRFLQERNMAVYRYEQIRYEFEQTCEALEEAGVFFIPLKGAVIRALYPEPWMRTSCDIDIFVKESELDQVAQFLCKRLGYVANAKRSVNDLSLYSPGGVHLELHYDLTEGDKYCKDILSNIFDYVQPIKEGSRHLVMSNEVFYLHHVSHMAKHFENGGCGIRSFLDVWLLNKCISFDKKERDKLLKQGGLLKFAQASEKLSLIWFENAEGDAFTEQLEEYILTGGIYGTLHNRVSMQQVKKGGKFKYILSRIFISNKELKLKYPTLHKRPWLMPFYHVKRWFNLLNKDRREKSVKELQETTHGDAEQQARVAKLLKDLNL